LFPHWNSCDFIKLRTGKGIGKKAVVGAMEGIENNEGFLEAEEIDVGL